MITSEALRPFCHGFLTRRGGTSEGLYASLNCGFGSRDEASKVAANRALAMERLGLQANTLVSCFQEHTADVVTVTEPWEATASPVADALVTDRPGIALGILTADCAPVLLADRRARVIGAAHAGWRGALGGVLDNVIASMEALGAEAKNITAVVGPCIALDSYEVGGDFPQPFLAAGADNRDFFVPSDRDGYFRFDLRGYVIRRLKSNGVEQAVHTGHDTYADEENFFSYRRTTHRGESDYGRGISIISLGEA